MEQLLDVTAGLAEATCEDDVVRAITTRGIPALGAAYGGVWLLDREEQILRMAAVSTLPRGTADRWTTVPLDHDAPVPECARTGEPIFLDSLADYQVRYPSSFMRIQDTISHVDTSYAMVPIADHGRPIGVLAVTYDRAHALGPSDRTYLRIVARQCAVALRRLELSLAERTARSDAEEATRAREEILSVVSHDLRDPLGTILTGVSTLQYLVDAKAEKARAIIERIERQSDRMARMIEDLIDFAGIQAGELSLERRPTQPDRVIAATAERYGAIAEERGIGFAVDVPAGLPTIDIDLDRAVQVMSNLLANAIKVTTKGSRVAIGAIGGSEVVFFVRDSGPGIDADELPRLFERYWRSKKATYRGAGLALTIARGIVDAHHGRIWAESQVGVGATFFFTLTCSR